MKDRRMPEDGAVGPEPSGLLLLEREGDAGSLMHFEALSLRLT